MGRRGGPTITIGDVDVRPGSVHRVDLPVARLPTGTWETLPIQVINGWEDGPLLWTSGAIHGDELNGIEIVREVVAQLDPRTLRGALIAVPIVNVFGLLTGERTLPDRRDLNRSFPGSPRGSFAARDAHLFLTTNANRCGYGIDFHTGSHHRDNLAQVRAQLADPETRRIAEAFGAPIMIDARTRDGSLREVASRAGSHVLLFEGGEALRFDPDVIRLGVAGTLRVLAALGMIDGPDRPPVPSRTSSASTWVRARRSGIVRLFVEPGDEVARGAQIGEISDAFREDVVHVRAATSGLVVGLSRNPLANQGDGLVHIAELDDA